MDQEPEMKERSGWNRALLDAMKDKEALMKLSQQARNEILSTEYLKSQRPIHGSTGKMAAAGDDIGL